MASVFDIISKPIGEAKKKVTDLIAKPIKAFKDDSSALGIAKNTVKGLPQSTAEVAKDIVQGTARSFASAGMTALGQKEMSKPEGVAGKVYSALYGDQPVKDIQGRTTDATKTLETYGFSPKTSKTLGGIGVVGSTALDLFPGTSGKTKVVNQLVKETSEQAVKEILVKNFKNFSRDAIENFATKIASSKNADEVGQLLADAAKVPLNAADKLINLVKEAKPLRREISAAQSAERAARAQNVGETFTQGKGESGFIEGLSKLKGELTPNKPVMEGVRDKLKQVEVDELFNRIQQFANKSVFDKVHASNGLAKLLSGEVPQPSQLSELEDIFGSDLVRALNDKKGALDKGIGILADIVNIPKSLTTSLDASAVLRQNGIFMASRPKISAGAIPTMFKKMFSEKFFNKYLDDVYKTPEYAVAKDAGLYLADPRKIASPIGGREETFISNLAERIPIFGTLNKASSRAYSGYLNKVRFDVFNDLATKFKAGGEDSEEVLKGLANYVNTATGRGNLGKLAKNIDVLNTFLFSPRFLKSRFDLINPAYYAKLPAPVRKEAMGDMLKFVATGSSIVGLAKLAGADVEMNPTSSDFGKIKIGNTRWDIWGGFQQWARIISQLASGKRTTASGEKSLTSKEFGAPSRLDIIENFARGKLSPGVGALVDYLDNKTVVGEEVGAKQTALRLTVPLYLQDLKEAYDEGGFDRTFGVALPAFFGVGTQTYGGSGGGKGTGQLPGLPELPKLPKGTLPKLPKLPSGGLPPIE